MNNKDTTITYSFNRFRIHIYINHEQYNIEMADINIYTFLLFLRSLSPFSCVCVSVDISLIFGLFVIDKYLRTWIYMFRSSKDDLCEIENEKAIKSLFVIIFGIRHCLIMIICILLQNESI